VIWILWIAFVIVSLVALKYKGQRDDLAALCVYSGILEYPEDSEE